MAHHLHTFDIRHLSQAMAITPSTRNRGMTTTIYLLLLLTLGVHRAAAALTQALCSNYNTGQDSAEGKHLLSVMQGSLTGANRVNYSE